MRKSTLPFVCCALLALVQSPAAARGKAARAGGGPLARSRQLVLVTTRGWDEVRGTLERFARKNSKAAWRPVGEKIPVVVGRNGLGWGAGLNAPPRGGAAEKGGGGELPPRDFRPRPA